MRRLITRKRVCATIVTMLLMLAALSLCIPSVRTWLTARPDRKPIRIESATALGPEGRPLADERVAFNVNGNGTPTRDGKALFWVTLSNTRGVKWAVLRLPDCRVLATVEGLDQVFWVDTAQAAGARFCLRPWARWPLPDAWRRYNVATVLCWTIDWHSGIARPVDVSSLPDSTRPEPNVYSVDGVPQIQLVTPAVHESVIRKKKLLSFDYDPKVGQSFVETEDLETHLLTNICYIPALKHGGPFCWTGDDTAIVTTLDPSADGRDEAFVLTLSTGKLEKIPWPDENTSRTGR